MTDVPSLGRVPSGGGTSLMVLRSKTPGMLYQSASFNGVFGFTWEIPFTAYRNFPSISASEFANITVLTTGMVP